MALVKCRECGREVSDQAETCPHCGIKSPGQPSGAPPRPTAAPAAALPKKKGNGCLTFIGIFFVAIVVIVIIGSNSSPPNNQNSTPQPSSSNSQSEEGQAPASQAPTCSSDWHACKDNADLVNNSMKWGDVQAACQTAVDKDVQYGEPKWPGFMAGGAFGTFLTGKDYVSTGIVTAIEPDVQISNAFGGMVHSTARCEYDLNSGTILDVSVNPN